MFFFVFFCTDVIVQYMVLGCNRTLFGIDVIMPTYVALMLLCLGSRTFSVGTDVLVLMYGCTDVIVQHIGLVLRVLEPVVWQ